MIVKLLTEHHLEFLSLKGGCTGSSESTLVKMPNFWKSHVAAQMHYEWTLLEVFQIFMKVRTFKKIQFKVEYLHFRSKPLMNLKIFATVHSLMNDFTDSCQAHLHVQNAPKIEFIRQKWHWCCDWQRATPELHMQNKTLVFPIGGLCSHWLFRFSVLHSNKTVNTISYQIQNCIFPKL